MADYEHESTAEILRRLEDSIENIDYPGEDTRYWIDHAKELARWLAMRASDDAGSDRG